MAFIIEKLSVIFESGKFVLIFLFKLIAYSIHCNFSSL